MLKKMEEPKLKQMPLDKWARGPPGLFFCHLNACQQNGSQGKMRWGPMERGQGGIWGSGDLGGGTRDDETRDVQGRLWTGYHYSGTKCRDARKLLTWGRGPTVT